MSGIFETAGSAPEDILGRLPSSARGPGDVARAFLDLLATDSRMASARLNIDDPVGNLTFAHETAQRNETADCHYVRQALPYGADTIGWLELDIQAESEALPPICARLTRLARPLARFFRRFAVQSWCRSRFGQPMTLVGGSAALLAFEALLERASLNDLPVLLEGEFGTEKLVCALSIHSLSQRREGPFIEVSCSEPHGEPGDWFAAAEGGTLFLNGIEKLSPANQERVPHYMRSHLGQWLKGKGAGDVRVIASAGAHLEAQAEAGRFSKALLAEVQILSLSLPTLRERRSDIEALVDWALIRRGFEPEQKKTADLIATFQAHVWRDNLVELERAITRLAVMTDDKPIHKADILQYAPWILVEPEMASAPPAEIDTPVQRPALVDWATVLLAQDQAPVDALHPSLRRVLRYLANHCTEALTIADLAEIGHVSSSHLGFLFRTELHTSFKQLQSGLRLMKARDLLIKDKRRQITDVALWAGYTDLSHFEKAFRRQFGQTPRLCRSEAF